MNAHNPDELAEADLLDLLGPDWREFDLERLALRPQTGFAGTTDLEFFDLTDLAPIAEEG